MPFHAHGFSCVHWTCGQDVSFPTHKPQEEQLAEVTQLRQQLEDVNKDCAEKRSQLDAVATELEAAKLTISELRRDVSDNRVSSLFLHPSYVTRGGPAASQCSSLPHSMCLTTLRPSPPLPSPSVLSFPFGQQLCVRVASGRSPARPYFQLLYGVVQQHHSVV